MNNQIRLIAERLRGLREALDLSTEEFAAKIGVDKADYEQHESGKFDIPMSLLFRVAQTFGIDTTELLSGDTARASAFYVTRKGTGISVERRRAYKYQALGAGFVGNKSEIFEVTVEPNDEIITLNSHTGQEFNYLLGAERSQNQGAPVISLDRRFDYLYINYRNIPDGGFNT